QRQFSARLIPDFATLPKRGAKGFAVTNVDFAVSRTLEVAEGMLSLAPAEGQRIADIVIVRTGAVLDLGGKTASCRVLIPYSGATIQNGTLASDCRGYVAAAGEIENFVVDPDLAVYYPFRSAETLAKDFSCQGNADLLKGGAPAFVPEGRFGGCVYFDGTTYLTNNVGVFPASLPTGKTDNTLLAHVKGGSESFGSQAIVTIGKAETYKCNVMQAANATTLRHFVWNDSNYFTASLPTGDSLVKGWHSVATTMAWNADEGKGYHALWAEGMCLTNGPILTSGGVVVTPNVAAESFTIAGHLIYQSNFKGWVDEVAVMKRALTEAEMQTYRDRGVPGLVKAENVHLMSAEGATLNVAASVTSAWVEGPGAISTFGLTVTGVITNAPSLSGDLTLADGARVVTDLDHPIVVEGPAELPGGGTIQVSQADFSTVPLPVARTIVQATSLSVADLANWSVEGLPPAIKAKPVVEGHELRLCLSKSGLVVVIR
ncbi:MAG: hypothetical protein ACI4Q3_02365, partial [Kiritimatiellia bacterium]